MFITKIYILVHYIFIIIWLKNKNDLFQNVSMTVGGFVKNQQE